MLFVDFEKENVYLKTLIGRNNLRMWQNLSWNTEKNVACYKSSKQQLV